MEEENINPEYPENIPEIPRSDESDKPKEPKKSLKELLMFNNPFYLISALLMIIGCYLVLSPFQQGARSLADILIYLSIVNVYEVILIVTAIYIMVKKQVFRDGIILLIIEGFFLADVTLINPVFQFQGLWAGLFLSMLAIGLSATKIFLIVKYLNLSLSPIFYRFMVIGMVFLYLFGNIIALGIRQGFNNEMLMFIIWSTAGIIPIALLGISNKKGESSGFREKTHLAFSLILSSMAFIHLATMTWIVSSTFYLCFLATFLIAFAVIIAELKPHWKEGKILHWIQYALPISAVLITLDFPAKLVLNKSALVPIAISPLRISLTLSALVFFYFFMVYRRKLPLGFSAIFLLISFMGYDLTMIGKTIERWLEWIEDLLPETKEQWGIVSIIGAFVVFIFGFLVSLKKAKLMSLHNNEGKHN
ncbi:MAG: hypothetical protein HY811_04295 [Planctomycetes bacterium]|nr:hypothetical protein [Planctomycetota bacterium]